MQPLSPYRTLDSYEILRRIHAIGQEAQIPHAGKNGGRELPADKTASPARDDGKGRRAGPWDQGPMALDAAER